VRGAVQYGTSEAPNVDDRAEVGMSNLTVGTHALTLEGLAQHQAELELTIDTAWLITGSIFVIFIQVSPQILPKFPP